MTQQQKLGESVSDVAFPLGTVLAPQDGVAGTQAESHHHAGLGVRDDTWGCLGSWIVKVEILQQREPKVDLNSLQSLY